MAQNISTARFYRIDVEDEAARLLGRWGVQLPVLAEALPHGSGLDGSYHVTVNSRGRLSIETAYHTMDEWGGYNGWVTVRVVGRLDKASGEIILDLTAPRGDSPNGSCGLTEYLGDVFADVENSLSVGRLR